MVGSRLLNLELPRYAGVLRWSVMLWWIDPRGAAGQVMQGLLETSKDFYLWDINPVSFRPELHPALEIATLKPENNWTRLEPAETHQARSRTRLHRISLHFCVPQFAG